MPLPGHEGIPAGRAGGRRDVGVVEEGSFFRDTVKGRRLYHGVVRVDRGMRPAPVVGNAEEDVGALGGTAGEGEEKEDEKFHIGLTLYVFRCAILA